MKLRDRSWFAFTTTTTLCLTTACGPTVAVSETEGATEGSTGSSTGDVPPNPTMPMTTTPDPSVGTGDVTGEPSTSNADNPTTTLDDTTTGAGSDSCCEVHESAGCNEEGVVDCVCAQEAFCCAFEWDQNCVDLAMSKCMATCEGPGTTTDEPGTTTTGAGSECVDLIQIEMLPSEATYSGDWTLGMSMVGEGEISVNQMGGPGTFLYEPDIPCDDTWYIWARAFDNGSEDSYFATLDGMPMPEAIFEGDCTGGGGGYVWAPLNWRDQAAGPCEYVENPWAPEWTTGLHQIEFSFREAAAMGRIVITNDENYIPM
jgi:hypothetical protein